MQHRRHRSLRLCATLAAAAVPLSTLAYQDENIQTLDDSVVRYDLAGGQVAYAFTNAIGSVTVSPQRSLAITDLLVAGGGGAGGWTIGGGGGGGGVVTGLVNELVFDSDITLSVGAGGDPQAGVGSWPSGLSGGASTFSIGATTVTAYGGGGGAGWNPKNAANTSAAAPIANGGGGANNGGKGGTGIDHNGGNPLACGGNDNSAGGGAGAGGDGLPGNPKVNGIAMAGVGGPGITNSITGVALDYGAGGGGGGGNNTQCNVAGGDSAGDGGCRNATGIASQPGFPGKDGRGGGGGGGGYNAARPGGKGGTGTVIFVLRAAALTIANPVTGDIHYTIFDSAQVLSVPDMEPTDSFQFSFDGVTANLPADGWLAAGSDLPVLAFPAGTAYGTVTVYLHVRSGEGTVTTSSASIEYLDPTDTSAPTVVTKDIAVSHDLAMGPYALSPAAINDGSSDATYGIWGMGVTPASLSGSATVTLTVTNRAGKAASATAQVTIHRLDVNVATDGDDGTGDGSAEHPFATITHALAEAQAGYAAGGIPVTVYVAPGTYSAAATGETFPLTLPAGVSLVGAGMGETILDGAAGAVQLVLADSAVPGRVAGISFRRALTRAIQAGTWGGTIDDCEISDVSAADQPLYIDSRDTRDVVVSGLVMTNIATTAQKFYSLMSTGGNLTVTNCLFRELSTTMRATQGHGNFSVRHPTNLNSAGWKTLFIDCVFEKITTPGADTHGGYEGGMFFIGLGPSS